MPRITTLSLLAALTLSACGTVAGAGRDLQVAGAAITQEARAASR
ncbi:MAG: entericidin A/B family lipoprotein [Pseudotabrizicola sp.]|nr:entericidin A/B family lipoprotein [Pseudotabrizicola sp.]MDO8882839.1 entericidin A/B family lipoprotein [Pseudotabrizicola sp.]MDP2080588.1 entericidin A/B family lipoprotein [Pseudotabrizicola sp.]MDZ7573316.1 entericidin A/B family lipoprotein [Pseudotabrizicola sp.]